MIYDATPCHLGEGPLWHPERQQLFWFDILQHRMHASQELWQFDTFVSAAGWVDLDTLLIASAKELFLFNVKDGNRKHICPLEADNPLTRSNDGRADPQGGFWIGTMGIEAQANAGAIYRYYKGELRKLFDNISISNAICFAPDGNTAFFTDTPTQKIMRVALDQDGWPAAEAVVHIDLSATDFHPDGAVVDENGNLFSAQWGSGRIAVYDPNGTFIESFAVPGAQSTCPSFGGPDLQTLFCTSAAVGLNGDEDGKTFKIETNYTGQKEHRVLI